MTRYRVLHTMTTFAASSGAAENMRLTLKLLPRDRFEVFLATEPGQSMEATLPQDVTLLPLSHLARPIRPHRDLLALAELYRLCRRWRFDVIHTHNSKDGIVGRWAARFAGVPVLIHTLHNLPFRASTNRVANRAYAAIERVTATFTDTLIAVSRENVNDCLAWRIGTPAQYRVIYSGLELERYHPALDQEEARARLGLAGAGALVGWIGRFNPQKDPITFLHAARVVLDALPDTRFVVCGGDDPIGHDLGPAVDRLARDLGIADHIRFLGFRSDLPVVLRAVDVVMHSSLHEGMGRIACEALLCGRPVAGTAVDGMREVIVSGVRGGILVPPRQPGALAEATLTLLRDRARADALASAGKTWVEANLSATKMVSDIAETYERALDA